jgi:hypothetical protein
MLGMLTKKKKGSREVAARGREEEGKRRVGGF